MDIRCSKAVAKVSPCAMSCRVAPTVRGSPLAKRAPAHTIAASANAAPRDQLIHAMVVEKALGG